MTVMQMKPATLTLLVVFCLLPRPVPAQEEAHWLIGRWIGNISGYIGRSSSSRTLRVTEVAPDGLAQGTWYVTGQQPLSALILVEGTEVKIATAGSSVVVLKREGDDLLVGKYMPESGDALPVKLIRVEGPT
jgi:hypothetical protein